MVKLPENREFLHRIYNILGQLNVATQGRPGLAQTRKSTARAFHWPSLPLCGGLAYLIALIRPHHSHIRYESYNLLNPSRQSAVMQSRVTPGQSSAGHHGYAFVLRFILRLMSSRRSSLCPAHRQECSDGLWRPVIWRLKRGKPTRD